MVAPDDPNSFDQDIQQQQGSAGSIPTRHDRQAAGPLLPTAGGPMPAPRYHCWYWERWFSDLEVMSMKPMERFVYFQLIGRCWVDGQIDMSEPEKLAVAAQVPLRELKRQWPNLKTHFTRLDNGPDAWSQNRVLADRKQAIEATSRAHLGQKRPRSTGHAQPKPQKHGASSMDLSSKSLGHNDRNLQTNQVTKQTNNEVVVLLRAETNLTDGEISTLMGACHDASMGAWKSALRAYSEQGGGVDSPLAWLTRAVQGSWEPSGKARRRTDDYDAQLKSRFDRERAEREQERAELQRQRDLVTQAIDGLSSDELADVTAKARDLLRGPAKRTVPEDATLADNTVLRRKASVLLGLDVCPAACEVQQ